MPSGGRRRLVFPAFLPRPPEATAISVTTATDLAFQRCIAPGCGTTYGIEEVRVSCGVCGNLLDVVYDWQRLRPPDSWGFFEQKWSRRYDPLDFSGVWRFRELLPFAPDEQIVTIGEGQTLLRASDGVAKYVGVNAGRLFLEYEGMNPSGSFKDNGMSPPSPMPE